MMKPLKNTHLRCCPLLLLLLVLLTSLNAKAYELRYPPVRWLADMDRTLQPVPKLRKQYDPLDGFLHSTGQQIKVFTSATSGVGSSIRKLKPGFKVESANVNNFGEVADSSWFTNRIGRYGVKPEDISKLQADCADLKAPFVVREAFGGGNRPTLLIDDGNGQKFIVHFDPPDAQGSVSSPAAVSSIILSASGYNAPLHCPIAVYKNSFVIGDRAQDMDRYGAKKPLTTGAFEKMFEKHGGQMRAVAVRLPDGIPIGRFDFAGRLFVDKNDRIRHQDRRELRGLGLISAFIGWIQISNLSTLNAFIEGPEGMGYAKHWFLNLVDVAEPGSNPFGAGASLTNEAFSLMDTRDAFWATRLIARFTDPLIDSIVAAAGFPDSSLARKAAAGLKERRDMLKEKWFGKISPLDDFVLTQKDGGIEIACADIETATRTNISPERRYRAQLTTPYERAVVVPWQESGSCEFTLGVDDPLKLVNGRVYELLVQSMDDKNEGWLPAVKLLVRAGDGVLELEGIQWGAR